MDTQKMMDTYNMFTCELGMGGYRGMAAAISGSTRMSGGSGATSP
jgi:hypothetical protein